MLIRYVCEYCGKVYKTGEKALACEERAKTLKAKFKKGRIVFDEDGYRYRVIDSEVWRKNWDRAYREKLIEGLLEVGMPIEHTFLYFLKSLDPETKNHCFIHKDSLNIDSLFTRVIFSKLKKPVGPRTEGINLLYEGTVFKEKNKRF